MSDETSMYLLNAKKLLNQQMQQSVRLTQPQPQQSVDDMLKYINNYKQSKQNQQKLLSAEPSISQTQHFSPSKLFALEKSKRLAYLYPQHSSSFSYQSQSRIYQKQLIEQSESYLQQQKQRNKLHSLLNQKIIQDIRNFDQAENPKLPLDDIYRQCQKFPNYLDFVEPVRREVTKPSFEFTEKDVVPKLVIEGYGYKKDEKVNYEEVMEIELEEETEESLEKQKDKKIKKNVQNIVRKNPKFLKLLGTYIMYFVKQELRQDPEVNILDQQSVKTYQTLTNIPPLPDHTLTFTQSLQKPLTPLQLCFNLSELQKPLSLPPKLFQKVANKRNGQSLKFHPKTFIMNGEQLVYHGQDSNMKMLIVKPQILQLKTVQKQIGGFFNREKVDTKSFIIKSEERLLEVEYHELEGSQIFKCMVDYFALQIYQCFCIHTETVESNFKRFLVSDEYTKWDFTDMNCSDEEMVEYALPYFFKALELRDTLKIISFKDNNLNFYTVEYILMKINQIQPQGLNTLLLSGNEFQNDGVKLYCSCFKKFKQLTKFQLQSCSLNTIHIEIISLYFVDVDFQDRDIHLLNLSSNPNAKLRQTSNNIINVLRTFKPKVFKVNNCKLNNDQFVDFLNFRFNIVEIESSGCGLVFNDEMIWSIIAEVERNYLLKVIIANENEVEAKNEVLMQLLERPQLREIAIDFPPEFFTDLKNPKNQWVIVPL